jgi:hypothetical protein
MAEVIRETTHDHRGTGWAGWAALIISIVALILAWIAYNRTGPDLENRVQQKLNQGIDNIQGQR